LPNEKLDAVAENFLKVFPVVIKYFIMLGNEVSDPDYSFQEYQALHVLKACGKVPISTVGSMLLISKPRMTVLVDKLIAAELIERIPDKKDRRIINIALTGKGKQFTDNHSQNLKTGVCERFAGLSEDEMERFLTSMKVMQGIMIKTKLGEFKL
jgi:DNA-binding MarR family transcriptional regulator